jgi:hypothetical protein
MPLKANVGLSRKVADNNYGSRGASINIELELDSSLIGEPAKFQDRIRQVYALARTALNEELNGNGHANAPTNGVGSAANGSANGNGASGQRPRPATQSQLKALHAIARSQRLDLAQYLTQHHRVNRPEDLDIKAASKVIDALKSNSQKGETG